MRNYPFCGFISCITRKVHLPTLQITVTIKNNLFPTNKSPNSPCTPQKSNTPKEPHLSRAARNIKNAVALINLRLEAWGGLVPLQWGEEW